jgi:hypothetical protein
MLAPGHRRVAPRTGLAALAALVIALLIATLPATAGAAGPAYSSGDDLGLTVPGDHSAGDQYVETLPTIGGPRAPKRNKRAKKLSKGVTKKLQEHGGSDAAALERLATSAALGAPAAGGTGNSGSNKKSDGKGSQKGRSRAKRNGDSAPAVPSAAINAADRGEAGLEWLVIAILVITALSLGAVGYQRHRDKDSTAK